MDVLNRISAGWRDLMDNKSDPRTAQWPLMSSPFPTMAICLTYVYIVKVLGPRLMENRKPFKLRGIIVVYNFFQVIFSFYLFWEGGINGWFGNYNWRCEAVDFSPKGLAMANVSWLYFFSKFTEFFDTFFFVLRKRYDQVSTLHVIHHGIMPFSVWWGCRFLPGGHSTFFGFLNTFVHIIMYTYYMIAAIGPEMQKYLWWKKYLTILQMVQFIGIMTHAFQLIFHNPCNYPMVFVYWIGAHAVMFYFLFSSFYKQAYAARKNKIAETKPNMSDNKKENGKIQSVVQSNGYCNGNENGVRNRVYNEIATH